MTECTVAIGSCSWRQRCRGEPPLQRGQAWLLKALASQDGWTTRILHGRLDNMSLHRVNADGVQRDGLIVQPSSFRSSAVAWLNGEPWRDPQPDALVPAGREAHTHGFAKADDGTWSCTQDYYAKGFDPSSGCGEKWEPAA